jgi:hypothetical protein
VRRLVSRLSFTGTFLMVMLAAAVWSGTWQQPISPTMLERVGISLEALLNGRPWLLFTSIFFSHDPGMLARQLLFAATVIGVTEWRWGGWRTLAWFFLLDITGTLALFILVVWPVSLVSHSETLALLAETDVGMSGGGFGLLGMLAAGFRSPLYLVVPIAVYAWLARGFFMPGDLLADILHLMTFTAGLFVANLTGARLARLAKK